MIVSGAGEVKKMVNTMFSRAAKEALHPIITNGAANKHRLGKLQSEAESLANSWLVLGQAEVLQNDLESLKSG